MPYNSTLELTGPQYRRLGDALQDSFTLAHFDQLLKVRLNINRESIALGNDFQTISFRVIDDLNRKGWVYKLVDAARKERPNNDIFVEYAQLLGIGPRDLDARVLLPHPNDVGLQSVEYRLREPDGDLPQILLGHSLLSFMGRVCESPG